MKYLLLIPLLAASLWGQMLPAAATSQPPVTATPPAFVQNVDAGYNSCGGTYTSSSFSLTAGNTVLVISSGNTAWTTYTVGGKTLSSLFTAGSGYAGVACASGVSGGSTSLVANQSGGVCSRFIVVEVSNLSCTLDVNSETSYDPAGSTLATGHVQATTTVANDYLILAQRMSSDPSFTGNGTWGHDDNTYHANSFIVSSGLGSTATTYNGTGTYGYGPGSTKYSIVGVKSN
jgi:hypothetical protein